VLAVAYDLKVFVTVVAKPPRRVCPVDVLAFMTAQRMGGDGRLQVAGAGGGGVSARTPRRRLSSVSGLRRADRGAAHAPGPGDGRGDGAGRAARCEVVGLRLGDLQVARHSEVAPFCHDSASCRRMPMHLRV
jgi:hypothetical protein